MFELLIGPPACGKSTFSAQRAQQGALITNDDATVTALHGGDYKLYNRKLKKLYKAHELLTMTMGAAIGADVVIDRTNMTRAMRARYVSFAKSIDVPIVAITFTIADAAEHARRRAKHDGRGYEQGYWHRVCAEMLAAYEPPRLDEGFDNIIPSGVYLQMQQEKGK